MILLGPVSSSLFVTPGELAEELGVTKCRINQLCHDGLLQYARLDGELGRVVIFKKSVDYLLQLRKTMREAKSGYLKFPHWKKHLNKSPIIIPRKLFIKEAA